MKLKAPSINSLIISTLIYSQFQHPSTCSPSKLETQILELKIKAITSVELSSMSFNELPSLFFLYENLVTKRFESVHKKDPKKFEEFRKIHQYHAIQNSFYSLKLKDVFLFEDFNAEDLDIISNKVNWTDQEVTKYGFLGKDKNGEFKFHEKAFADFFLAEYFLDNIVHPKDNPSDDEMELRLRYLFYFIANSYGLYSVRNDFIRPMFEDQEGEMFSDQVRMVMKYRFSSLLDPFLSKSLTYVEKMSTIFRNDAEILGNIWGIDLNQPFPLRYFKFSNEVKELKALAEKFFKIEPDLTSNSTKPQADNIFRGKNQILNILSIIHDKKNEHFTKDILEVTKYEVSDEILTKLSQTENFVDFVDQSSFPLTDKKEFYMSNAYNLIGRSYTADKLTQLWNRMEKYFTKDEMKQILVQKDQHLNHTHLFHLPSKNNLKYVETFLNLTRTYLNPQEVKEFLSQRRPICQESFLTHYLRITENSTVYEYNYNFTKEFLTHDELKNLIFDNKDIPFIKKVADKEEMFKLGMKIVSEFFIRDEIQDMLMVTDDRQQNIIFWVANAYTSKSSRPDVADYLRDIFKGREDKLRQMFRTMDIYGANIFDKFKGSYYEKKIQPFLDLAKEIFTDDEYKKLYNEQN